MNFGHEDDSTFHSELWKDIGVNIAALFDFLFQDSICAWCLCHEYQRMIQEDIFQVTVEVQAAISNYVLNGRKNKKNLVRMKHQRRILTACATNLTSASFVCATLFVPPISEFDQ